MAGERTEAATPRKLQELRKEGQIARSVDLSHALEVLAGFLLLQSVGGNLVAQLREYLRLELGSLARLDLAGPDGARLASSTLGVLAAVMLPVLLMAPAVAVVAGVGQSGLLFSPKAAAPQFSRIDPIQGFRRLFSSRSVVELFKTLAKVVLVGWILGRTYAEMLPTFVGLVSIDLPGALRLLAQVTLQLGVSAGLVLLVLGLLDYGYQRWEFRRSARMSKQEVKEEARQSESSPEVRARLRQRQRKLAMSRMMQAVPTADVVVTNPTHLAVALVYRGGEMPAPRVVAKGADRLAERIRQIAGESDVPLVENRPLAQALYRASEVGQEIPIELFQAVAEVLAHIYALRDRARLKEVQRGASA